MRTPHLLGLLGLLLVATPAFAEPRGEPVVLAVDGKDIYVDLGAKDGVGAGAQLQLLHEVIATDPTTGKQLHDQFALGTLAVARSGDGTSVAHADEALAKRVLAGDHVRLVGDKKTYVDPWQAQVDASHPVAAVPVNPTAAPIDHAALAREAWQATLGQAPEQRIARWQELLAADPQTGYRRAIESSATPSPRCATGAARSCSRATSSPRWTPCATACRSSGRGGPWRPARCGPCGTCSGSRSSRRPSTSCTGSATSPDCTSCSTTASG
ncbi:MAG TPA: hypothetical protein VIV58_12150, partial [Kofleriaceae bacterium]